jgi:hypothetical protein
MTTVEQQLESINNKLDVIVNKMVPLLDILQTVIRNNISNESLGDSPKKEIPELAFKIDPISDNIVRRNVYIYGKKTYENKDLIKSKFSNATWNREHNSWMFDYYFNIENDIKNVFPNIIEQNFV